jgi:hypothetical protein
MPGQMKLEFEGIVRNLGKVPDEPVYRVIFQRQAAIYSIDENDRESINALMKSNENKIPVKVTHDVSTMKIIKAELK